MDLSLAALATGPVDRVWYSGTGSLLIHAASGRVFETSDYESWHVSPAVVPAESASRVTPTRLPDNKARVRAGSKTIYAVAGFAWKTESGGAAWDNLTSFRGTSIVGELADLAVSPSNDDEITVGGSAGVFRSMDGGQSWSGLNQMLPNLPATRLLSLPAGDRGVRVGLSDGSAVAWEPGQKTAWTPADNLEMAREKLQRQVYGQQRGGPVTAVATSGETTYIGMADGKIEVSSNRGATWTTRLAPEAGMVERFWVDPDDPRIALVVFGARARESNAPANRVARTIDGGYNWDDVSSNLPDAAAHGVAADRASGAVYVGTSAGVYMSYIDLATLGQTPVWQALPGLSQAPVTDVKLDDQGHQLWAATDGYGVYSTLAPHRLRDPRVVSSADQLAHATAPGALVSVLGAHVDAARAGDLSVPVLDSNGTQSQLQIPFEMRGTSVALAVNGSSTPLPAVPLAETAPSIFLDPDGSGTPMLLDADSGVMLDAMNPAHSRGRIQILATGLGRVNPDWPTGIAAPQENPPQVAATVQAYLDRQPVEVTRAVLAPYIGFYLVEIEVPKIVNYGPAELYIDVGGQTSNRVRVYIQP
jgi:uncharacterized protein (TIGR03437 family)